MKQKGKMDLNSMVQYIHVLLNGEWVPPTIAFSPDFPNMNRQMRLPQEARWVSQLPSPDTRGIKL